LSLLPVTIRVIPVPHLDKAAHLCEYLVFAWLLVQAIRAWRLQAREYLWLAWMYATSYGVLMEVLQALVPWRSADWWDVACNALGAALGVWLARRYQISARRLTEADI
jgi:VanZ family protein